MKNNGYHVILKLLNEHQVTAGAARIVVAHTHREAFRNYEYFTNTL